MTDLSKLLEGVTELPWVATPMKDDPHVVEYFGKNGELVLSEASMFGFNNLEDQEFAFHAANSFPALVRALEEAEQIVSETLQVIGAAADDDDDWRDRAQILNDNILRFRRNQLAALQSASAIEEKTNEQG